MYRSCLSLSLYRLIINNKVHWLSQPQPPASGWIRHETDVSTYIYDNRDSSWQTVPSPSLFYSLTHTHRSLVTGTTTPILWLNPPRDLCIYVYMTTEITLVSLDPLRPYAPCHTCTQVDLTSLHPPRPYATVSHIHTTPSPRPHSSRSHTLGFLESLTRTTVSYCVTTRTSLTVCLPSWPSVCEVF
jgi:hypothetical protein